MRDDRSAPDPPLTPARSASGRSAESVSGAGDVSLLDIVNVLLRHRKSVVLLPLALAVVAVLVAFIVPPTFTSQASFMPQGEQEQASRLAGLASQVGISIPMGQSGESPEFYADLLRSRELLKSTVETTYRIGDDGAPDGEVRSGDLVNFYEVDEESRPVEVAEAIQRLRESLTVSTNPETSVIEVEVTSRWPELSRQVADRLLELVNRFNLERRQTQASAERAFIEEQVARAESALRVAEDSLERFLEQNRGFEGSPTLRFEHDRLQRRVDLRQQLYTSLSESFQQARIDEVRNTPVVTVVERPEVPPRPDSRQLVFRAFLGLLLGALVGVLWAFGKELLRGAQRQEPDDYAEFSRLVEEAKVDLRRLWSRLPGVEAG